MDPLIQANTAFSVPLWCLVSQALKNTMKNSLLITGNADQLCVVDLIWSGSLSQEEATHADGGSNVHDVGRAINEEVQ
jgi:hypothetical protein